MTFLYDPVLSFLRHISPALLSVLLGAFYVQRFFVRRANEAHLIDLLLAHLESIRCDALAYWNLSQDDKNRQKQEQLLAQKLKGAIQSLHVDLSNYSERYCANLKSDFGQLVADLSDACTGGGFETAQKQADPSRYLVVCNTINRLRTELLKRKL